MTSLVIVESPAKCKKIEEYLGESYKCMASFGHLTNLTDLKCIDIDNDFKVNYTIIKEKHKTVHSLQKAIKNSAEVILASDDDREGEAIAWHICKLFDLPVETTPRIIFHEITKESVLKAVKNPTHINMNLVHSQQTRQILDILVGFKFSPILWKHLSPAYKDGLSAGRCQTPTLRIIYDNALEVNNNTPIKTNQITGYFTKQNVGFVLNNTIDDKKTLLNFINLSPTFQHKLLKNESIYLQLSEPPKPFNTSVLQQKSFSLLRTSPKETMLLAQKLYENGLITYMRTDNRTFCKEFCDSCQSYIISVFSDNYFSDINKNKTKNSQNAHEAIRPTNIRCLPGNLATNDKICMKGKKLYELIWKTTVQSFMTPSKKQILPVIITAPNSYFYKYKFQKCVFDGWEVIDKHKEKTQDDDRALFEYFNLIKHDSVINYNRIKTKETLLNTKSHISYSSLIKILEERGIGRPSTYASIIDKNISRGYIKLTDIPGKEEMCENYTLVGDKLEKEESMVIFGNEKNKLVIQPLGFVVIDFMLNHFPNFFNYTFTAEMESKLDLISQNERDSITTCKEYFDTIENTINNASIDAKQKFKLRIDNEHDVIVCKYGVTIQNNISKIYSKIKDDINMFQLINNEYTIDNITTKKISDDVLLGKYQEQNLYLKNGKYGYYLTWGTNTKSLNGYSGELSDKKLGDVISFIENTSSNSNIVRIISEFTSIRNGKYGLYIYHKTKTMKKPQFLKLYGCPFLDNIETCKLDELKVWIKQKYEIQ